MTTDNYSDHSPIPWVVDDNRPGFEGMVAVFDADGRLMMSFGDMENCSWRDICDAHIVARAVTAHAALVAACGLNWLDNPATHHKEVTDLHGNIVYTSPDRGVSGAVQATHWINCQRRAALALAGLRDA